MFFKPLLLLPFLFSSLRLLAHTSVKFKLCANARRMRRLENLEVDATLTSLAASALICMSVKFIREANNEIILKSGFYHKKSIHEALPTASTHGRRNEIFYVSR